MNTALTLDEALETVVDQAQEIERLKSLVSTVKGATNGLLACLAEFGDDGNWEVKPDSEGRAMEWRWLRGHPSLLTYRALQHYYVVLKQWDTEHPTGVERLRR